MTEEHTAGPTACSDQILHEKMVTINHNINIKALLDSGSSTCLMRKSVALRYGLVWTEDNSIIEGFGATAVTTVIGKITITLKVDEAIISGVVIYIVPEACNPHDFLIGRPWCEASKISFIKYNKTLTFYNTIAFPFLTTDLAQTNDGTG